VGILDWIENPKHREAGKRLCHLLNRKEIKLSGPLKDFRNQFDKVRLTLTLPWREGLVNLTYHPFLWYEFNQLIRIQVA